MVFRNRGAQFPPRDRARADLIKVNRLPPSPQSAGRPRASSLPRTARRLRLRFLQLTWALRPRPHVTRFPDRRHLLLCPAASPHAAGGPGTPRPPARTPPEPGSAATSGTRDSQVGRVPPPGRGRPQAQTSRTRRPRLRATPADLTTSAALTATPGLRFLRPRAHAGLAAPQSIHAPRRLLGTLAQPPRPHCNGATVCCPVRRRRRRPALPGPRLPLRRWAPAPAHQRLLSRTARDSLPRPALVAYAERTPPIGPRAVARAELGLSNSSRGARRRRPGAERGYYRSFGGAAADST